MHLSVCVCVKASGFTTEKMKGPKFEDILIKNIDHLVGQVPPFTIRLYDGKYFQLVKRLWAAEEGAGDSCARIDGNK